MPPIRIATEKLGFPRRSARESYLRSMLQFSPWHVEEGSDECPDDEPYAVVNDETEEVEGCHATSDEADAQIAELEDAEGSDAPSTDAATDSETGAAFTAVLCVEGMDTGDGRYLEVEGGTWRTLPIPLKAMFADPMLGGHGGSQLAGRIDRIERSDRRILGYGVLDTGEVGTEAARLIRERVLRGVSIDIGDADVEPEVVAVDEEGWPVEIRARFTTYEIGAATACSMQALKLAVIWLDDMDEPEELSETLPAPIPPVEEPEVVDDESNGIVILASGLDDDEIAALPPASAFEEPDVDGPTPITITEPDEHGWRRIYGNFAQWGECHIGIPGVCVTAPPSPSDYAYFRLGTTRAHCDCGETHEDGSGEVLELATGVLTFGPGHAGKGLSATAAAWHYENTCAAFADVVSGENEWGPWIAGVIRPDVTEAELRTIRAQKPSGDWRFISGHLDLVAILFVNTPGFPVPRTGVHVTASGVQTSLVAAASPTVAPDEPISRVEYAKLLSRFAELEGTVRSTKTVTDLFVDDAAERLAKRLGR